MKKFEEFQELDNKFEVFQSFENLIRYVKEKRCYKDLGGESKIYLLKS